MFKRILNKMETENIAEDQCFCKEYIKNRIKEFATKYNKAIAKPININQSSGSARNLNFILLLPFFFPYYYNLCFLNCH